MGTGPSVWRSKHSLFTCFTRYGNVFVRNKQSYILIISTDYVGKRVFWIDAKLHTISSANYDGTGRREILHNAQQVRHPFSITVFEVNKQDYLKYVKILFIERTMGLVHGPSTA